MYVQDMEEGGGGSTDGTLLGISGIWGSQGDRFPLVLTVLSREYSTPL